MPVARYWELASGLTGCLKPGSDDVRDSPALNVVGRLQLQGATVNVYDPKATDNSRKVVSNAGIRPVGSCRM